MLAALPVPDFLTPCVSMSNNFYQSCHVKPCLCAQCFGPQGRICGGFLCFIVKIHQRQLLAPPCMSVKVWRTSLFQDYACYTFLDPL